MQEDTAPHTALDTVPVGSTAYVYWKNIGGLTPQWRLFVQTLDANGKVLAELSVHENDGATLAETILRHAVTGPFELTDGINVQ